MYKKYSPLNNLQFRYRLCEDIWDESYGKVKFKNKVSFDLSKAYLM